MASEDREDVLVLCVELDFLTLASGVSRLQTQCPCQSGGRTLGWQNVEWGVWCEVISFWGVFFGPAASGFTSSTCVQVSSGGGGGERGSGIYC